jgi:hypothetical protein
MRTSKEAGEESKMNTEPITFAEYQKIAQFTATYPGKSENILYPALGLCGEASELHEKYCQFPEWVFNAANPAQTNEMFYSTRLILKECGDWLWYATDIATELDIPLTGIWHLPTNFIMIANEHLSDYILSLCYYSGKVAEEAKKQLRDDKVVDMDVVTETICIGLDVIKLVSNFYTSSDKGLYVVAHMNNEKLLARRANGTIHGSGDER